jgi:hypothetical protein
LCISLKRMDLNKIEMKAENGVRRGIEWGGLYPMKPGTDSWDSKQGGGQVSDEWGGVVTGKAMPNMWEWVGSLYMTKVHTRTPQHPTARVTAEQEVASGRGEHNLEGAGGHN